jgi:capsid portal protein
LDRLQGTVDDSKGRAYFAESGKRAVIRPKRSRDSNGVNDRIKVIPIGENATKDEYERIKNVTLQEILIMHRIQPALAAMVPKANGGFGDIQKNSRIYYENEMLPMQQGLLEVNDYLPQSQWLRFAEPEAIDEK